MDIRLVGRDYVRKNRYHTKDIITQEQYYSLPLCDRYDYKQISSRFYALNTASPYTLQQDTPPWRDTNNTIDDSDIDIDTKRSKLDSFFEDESLAYASAALDMVYDSNWYAVRNDMDTTEQYRSQADRLYRLSHKLRNKRQEISRDDITDKDIQKAWDDLFIRHNTNNNNKINK